MAGSDKVEISAVVVDDTGPGVASVNKSLDSVAAKADSSTASAASSFKSLGSNLKAVGSTLSTFVTAPIVGVAVASSVMAAKFQQNMELLHTEAGVPQSALKSLSNSILNMAGQVGQGPESLAEAMYHIASNAKGVLTSAQMLDQLKVSAEAASMTGASLDDTTYTLSSTLASGISGAKGYADMMGVLNGIVGAGDMRFQDLNAAIGSGFLATGAQFGISIQSMGAALATLTDNGESADEAATRLRMSVALMSSPSAQAAKVLGALGLSGSEVKASTAAATDMLAKAHVTTTTLADDMRKPDGINVALQDLKTHLENSGLSADAADAAISKAFGGGRSDAAILTLLNNTKRTGEAFDAINKSSGDFQQLWAAQQQTPMQQFKDALASIQASMIKIGNDILPVVVPWFGKIAAVVQDVANWFDKLNNNQRGWVLAALGIAAIIGPVLIVLGTVASAIGAIIALGLPFLATIAIIGGLPVVAIAIMTHWSVITGFFRSLWQEVTSIFKAEIDIIEGIIGIMLLNPGMIADAWRKLGHDLPGIFQGIAGAFGNGALNIIRALMPVTGPLNTIYQTLTNIYNAANSLINLGQGKGATVSKSALAQSFNPLSLVGSAMQKPGLPSFDTGGVVPGPKGAPTLAIVHGGETVVPNSSSPAGSGGTISIGQIINQTEADWESMLRDLAWRIAGAN